MDAVITRCIKGSPHGFDKLFFALPQIACRPARPWTIFWAMKRRSPMIVRERLNIYCTYRQCLASMDSHICTCSQAGDQSEKWQRDVVKPEWRMKIEAARSSRMAAPTSVQAGVAREFCACWARKAVGSTGPIGWLAKSWARRAVRLVQGCVPDVRRQALQDDSI